MVQGKAFACLFYISICSGFIKEGLGGGFLVTAKTKGLLEYL